MPDSALLDEILTAKTRVYHAGDATPLQELRHHGLPCSIFVKREDLGPINAYKWRGAYNAVAAHHAETGCDTVVAASAGNHAQGVALAARKLGLSAKIFMPLSTPMMKQVSVRRHGGENVEIILHGDTYNEAADAAKAYVEANGLTYIHPFDDLYTMAGQATIADEIVSSGDGPFDIAFVQIGGGGIAAATAFWLKRHWPDIIVIGVEGIGQASMKASVEAGAPVTLPSVDTFCDGTAVTRPGDLTFDICRRYIDAFITVTNEEVSAAIQRTWDAMRVVPEPSGAMGLAGLVRYAEDNPYAVEGKKLLAVLCGANMDFSKLSTIARTAAIGAHKKHYLRFTIDERSGGLLGLLDTYFKDVNVSEFLYGKVDDNVAFPVIAFEATPDRMAEIERRLMDAGQAFEDVTAGADIRYRIINYNPALFRDAVLMHVQFPERKGALRDFMRSITGTANVCYFNYAYSGETIGHAVMGFEFENASKKSAFLALLDGGIISCSMIDEKTAARMMAF